MAQDAPPLRKKKKKTQKNTQPRQLRRRGSNQSHTARNTAGEQVEGVELASAAERVPSPGAGALQWK